MFGWILFWITSVLLALVVGAWAGVYFRSFAEPASLIGRLISWIAGPKAKP
jgi:hypothetical protein